MAKPYKLYDFGRERGNAWAMMGIGKHEGWSIGYGYTYMPSNNGSAFSRNHSSSPVCVYLHVDFFNNTNGESTRTEIIERIEVGHARRANEADTIGREGIKKHIRPLLDALIAKTFPEEKKN